MHRLARCWGAVALVVVALAAVGWADVDGRGFRVRAPRRIDGAAGVLGPLSVTIAPKVGYSISMEGPIAVRVDGPAEVDITRRTLSRRDAADPRAEAPRFETSVRARRAGEFDLSVSLSFWLCRKKLCWPVSQRVAVHLVAAEPAPDGGPISGDGGPDTSDGGPGATAPKR